MGSELLRIAEGFSIVAEGLRGLAKAEGSTKDKSVNAQPSATEKVPEYLAAANHLPFPSFLNLFPLQ